MIWFIVRNKYALSWLSLKPSSALYITPSNNAAMHKSVKWERECGIISCFSGSSIHYKSLIYTELSRRFIGAIWLANFYSVFYILLRMQTVDFIGHRTQRYMGLTESNY